MRRWLFCTVVLTSILFFDCSKSAAPIAPLTGIQWTFKDVTYIAGDSATYFNGAYISFDQPVSSPYIDEVLVFFSAANIKSGVYPVINGAFQKLTPTNCYIGLLINNLAYNSTGSTGSVTVRNAGNISTISFTNVMMLTAGSDSATLSGNLVTLL